WRPWRVKAQVALSDRVSGARNNIFKVNSATSFQMHYGPVIPLPSNFQKLSGLSRRSLGKGGCLTLATNVCLRAGAVKMLIAAGQLKLEPLLRHASTILT